MVFSKKLLYYRRHNEKSDYILGTVLHYNSVKYGSRQIDSSVRSFDKDWLNIKSIGWMLILDSEIATILFIFNHKWSTYVRGFICEIIPGAIQSKKMLGYGTVLGENDLSCVFLNSFLEGG